MAAHTSSPCAVRQRQGISRLATPPNLAWIGKLQVYERLCLKKNKKIKNKVESPGDGSASKDTCC